MVGPTDDERDVVVSETLRRWSLPAVAAAAALAVLAAGYVRTLPSTYRSTVKVRLFAVPGNPLSPTLVTSNQQMALAMASEVALVTAPKVVDAVNGKLGGKLSVASIQASIATNSDIVVIQFSAPTADRSRRGAQETAAAYLDYRATRARSAVAAQLAPLQLQARFTQDKVRMAMAALRTSPPPAGAGLQAVIYSSQLAKLQQTIGEVQATNLIPGSVLDLPSTPVNTDNRRRWLYPLLAALAGLAAIALAAVRDARRGRVVHGAGLSALRGSPILASVPGPHVPVNADRRDSALRENAYAQVRTAILTRIRQGSVISVSPVETHDTSTDVAVGIASSLRKAGFEAAVTDRPPSPSSGLRRRNDFVLVAGSPASTLDGMAEVIGADALILTVVDGLTTRAQTYAVLDRARQLEVVVIGIVLVARRASRRRPTGRSDSDRGLDLLTTSTEGAVLAGLGALTADSRDGAPTRRGSAGS